MAIDVSTEIIINCGIDKVSAFSADPDNAQKWYVNISSVEWWTSPPLRVGSKIAFIAHFFGQKLRYTYEVIEYEPNQKFVMQTSQGPFPMQTCYTWEACGSDSTKMILRNTGIPTGFSKIMTPFMSIAMKRANKKDLALLKQILEDK